MRQFSKRFFPPIAGLLSLLLVWFAIGALREDKYFGATYLALMCCAALLGVTAGAVWLEWKGGRVLAFLSGIALCVVATCATLLGLAFGAPSIPMLLTPILLFVAVIGFLLPSKESSDREPSDKSLECTRVE